MKKYALIILRVAVAIIILQTLRFKFTADPDSVYIFSKIGVEPYGRIGIGILELIAGILILIPKTVWLGAMLCTGIIGGAIIIHLTVLGVSVNNDKGLLFITALVTFMMATTILYFNRKKIPFLPKT